MATLTDETAIEKMELRIAEAMGESYLIKLEEAAQAAGEAELAAEEEAEAAAEAVLKA